MSETHSAPPAAATIEVTARMGELLDNALMGGHPATVAYVDGDNLPQLSHRGTLQRLNDKQLAMWARNPEGGILKALGARPTLAMLYSDFGDLARRIYLSFVGRGRIELDEQIRRQVYDSSPALERGLDPDMKGVAIVVDIDQIDGFLDGERVRMRRA